MNLQDFALKLQAQMQGRQSRFFGAARKGENYELRADLNSEYRDRRKDAIKRVIANMTVGKDVSGLFPDVLKNMQTEDLEQKKLVYLYLMNYAKIQPELVILAVNTFVKDTDDPNPLIRALAIRTMGCLRADKILDYISDPLRKSLSDDNPYVRKTAAICVAKLYDLKPTLAVENGFVAQLGDLISDANPMVVANAITALAEIQEVATAALQSAQEHGTPAPAHASIFLMDSTILSKLLIALGECTEWGRIALLGAVSTHRAADEKEAEHICERVAPQLQHANPAVVLAAIKCIMVHLKEVQRPDFSKQMLRKMAPPLVTLVSSPPEVQWVALRNISLILQAQPNILSSEMRVFFCKYNDPPYVKFEKLNIMVRLANSKNMDTLLSELREYASEADVDFVRKAIRAIGHCAVKDEAGGGEDMAQKCVKALLDLIQTGVAYVVQEAVIVLKDIFRKYPNRYEGVIPTLCGNLQELDEPEAKASLIWMIGEYAEQIENAEELLEVFVGTMGDETLAVQLQLLTATVKLFLKKPDTTQGLIQRVLQFATKTCDNPDLRDRAFVYWRLLSSQPELAKSVVLAQRPSIEAANDSVSPGLLTELVEQLGSLASVYHKPAETFVGRARLGAEDVSKKAQERRDESTAQQKALQTLVAGQQSENLLDMDEPVAESSQAASGSSNDFGLGGLSMDDSRPASTQPAGLTSPPAQQAQQNPLDDLLGLFDSGAGAASLGQPQKPATSTSTAAAAGTGDNLIDGFF